MDYAMTKSVCQGQHQDVVPPHGKAQRRHNRLCKCTFGVPVKRSGYELAAREYLTPTQAAAVFGRGRQFWRDAYDAGHVTGYTTPTGRRYLSKVECLEYLRKSTLNFRAIARA